MRDLSLFGDRIISKGLCPPRSPDLSSADLFLWGHIKDNACCNNPRSLHELNTNISNIIAEMTLQAVSTNMLRRAWLCMQYAGARFQNIL
jgi:hypothetical protein